MRFIHTADWQIGMKASHVGKAAERVRTARIETIRRIQHLARESNAEFVLVAGDTFEDHGVSRKLVGQVGDLLAGFDCPVYVIPGNHDPWTEGSVWDQARDLWSKQTQILVERAPIQVPGGWLYPCPLTQRWADEDPTKWISAESTGGIRIGVAHGSLQSPSRIWLTTSLPASARLTSRSLWQRRQDSSELGFQVANCRAKTIGCSGRRADRH